MNVDLKELEYLLGELEGLRVAILPTTWDDVLDTWLSLANLPRKMRGERSLTILEQVFDDEKLKEALGMANQLSEIVRGDNGNGAPDGLLMRLKSDAGGHIKDHYFGFVKAINDEIGSVLFAFINIVVDTIISDLVDHRSHLGLWIIPRPNTK